MRRSKLSYGLVGLAALLGTRCGRAVAPKEARACLYEPPFVVPNDPDAPQGAACPSQ